jgi:hypothetical protein
MGRFAGSVSRSGWLSATISSIRSCVRGFPSFAILLLRVKDESKNRPNDSVRQYS